MTGIQHPFFDLLPEHLADGIIEQRVFIGKVLVKRGTVDLCLISHILNGDRFKTLLGEEFAEGLQDQAAGPFDPRVKFFFFGVRQHFGSSVVYPTDSLF